MCCEFHKFLPVSGKSIAMKKVLKPNRKNYLDIRYLTLETATGDVL